MTLTATRACCTKLAPAAEQCHSCTSQCPVPCPATQSVSVPLTTGPQIVSPTMGCMTPEKCYYPSCSCDRSDVPGK